ncbi:hypothetical protein [Rhodococcus jostii]|uniref:hypothetical protein n=1 Tax=Rhodococcus jostii TaxID=132919 RepID=UPI00363861B3
MEEIRSAGTPCQKWYRSEWFERWVLSLLVVNIVVQIFPSHVRTVRDDPTPGNWMLLMLSGLTLMVSTAYMVRLWVTHLTATTPAEAVAPQAIPEHDIHAAIAAASDRIAAIKLLRDKHPTLGLVPAKNLIDAHTNP